MSNDQRACKISGDVQVFLDDTLYEKITTVLPEGMRREWEDFNVELGASASTAAADSDTMIMSYAVRPMLRKPVKEPANPLLVPTLPCEMRSVVVSTVLKDPEKGLFRMYYTSSGKDPEVLRYNRPYGNCVCYAESTDGLNWTKPSLRVRTFHGSMENNLFLKEKIRAQAPAVVYDPEQPRDKRYIIHLTDGSKIGDELVGGIFQAFSPDGIHWQYEPDEPIIPIINDSSNTFFKDPYTGKWVAFHRPGLGQRKNAYSTSDDLMTWTRHGVVHDIDDRDPPTDCFYWCGVQPYADGYLAVVPVYHKAYTNYTVDVQLLYARDLDHWTRVGDRRTFLETGPPRSHESQSVYPACNIVDMGGEYWLYYTGCNRRHTVEADEQPGAMTSICLARIRRDRFVAMQGVCPGAYLTTRMLEHPGGCLEVNAEAAGRAWVEVLDENGAPLPGYTRAEAIPLEGDHLDHAAAWRERRRLPDRPVRLRFYIGEGALFAFRIRRSAG